MMVNTNVNQGELRKRLSELGWYRTHERWIVLKSLEQGIPVHTICALTGITDATVYRWKKEHASGQPLPRDRRRGAPAEFERHIP